MKKTVLALFALATFSASFVACNNKTSNSSEETEHTDVVASGTYTGTAEKVDADEKEIYVKTGDGKTLELYFTDSTKLTKNDQAVAFDELKQGQSLEVTLEKKGERLEPLAVKIIQ